MINLVGNQADSVGGTVVGQLGKLVAVEHGAGGIARRCDHKAVDRPFDRIQHRRRRLEVGFRAERQRHDLDTERLQTVSISRKCGLRYHNPIARIEGGEKGEHEGTGSAYRHRDPLRAHLDAVGALAVIGDRPAKGRLAQRLGIAERTVPEQALGGLDHPLGRPAAGFTDFHMHDVMACRRLGIRGRQDVHGEKRVDAGSIANFASIGGFNCLLQGCRVDGGHQSIPEARVLINMGYQADTPYARSPASGQCRREHRSLE